eukprot:TRINITY_DN2048_c1_g2_i1.p1 TRINITY_DN2048_c1_g2~~TRINITY_DN2048_c1_g2_i1.p1  ORF type:complete len:192 (-),score=17.69 TRINITY_DN2048_c1_g2_i1:71-646(-)
MSFVLNVVLTGLTPLLAASVPKLVMRNGGSLSERTNAVLLGISAGLMFAIATCDLIPEAIALATGAEPVYEEGHNTEGHEGHDHGEGHEAHSGRVPMLGVGVGYLTLLLVDLFMRGTGHAHSHGPVGRDIEEVCAQVLDRERERDRQKRDRGERQRNRTHTHTHTETERHTEKDRERQREIQRETERHSKT